MTKGKLNPAESKPGDRVTLRLKDDVKSNGEVILKKGTTITGVVRSVKRAENKGDAQNQTKGTAAGQAQSLMEIEWLAPAAQGRSAKQLSIALQSVTHVNPLYRHSQEETAEPNFLPPPRGSASGPVVSSGGATGGGLLGGVAGTVGATTGVATEIAGTASSTVSSSVGAVTSTAINTTGSTAASTTTNAALLNMPSVMAVDTNTSSALESTFGFSSAGSQLFRVGRGELITAGGSKQSLDIFSRLNNDTVLTSQTDNFEITSGAQMRLLVGVQK
jgi:hypothetical protein